MAQERARRGDAGSVEVDLGERSGEHVGGAGSARGRDRVRCERCGMPLVRISGEKYDPLDDVERLLCGWCITELAYCHD